MQAKACILFLYGSRLKFGVGYTINSIDFENFELLVIFAVN
jgi:hypothetical protein